MSLHINDFKPTETSVHAALMPPAAVRELMNPVEDDTWVRHADFVSMERLRGTLAHEGESAAKRALLRDFGATTNSTTSTSAPSSCSTSLKPQNGTLARSAAGERSVEDAVMEGMMWQEQFLEAYKKQEAREDSGKALSYKQKMMEDFRKKHGGAAAPRA